jgi:hypothetical protein
VIVIVGQTTISTCNFDYYVRFFYNPTCTLLSLLDSYSHLEWISQEPGCLLVEKFRRKPACNCVIDPLLRLPV